MHRARSTVILAFENGGSSWYDALSLQFRKKMSNGLEATASYTWSHAINDVSGQTVLGGVPLSGNTNDSELKRLLT